jgi:hypothetical protein
LIEKYGKKIEIGGEKWCTENKREYIGISWLNLF